MALRRSGQGRDDSKAMKKFDVFECYEAGLRQASMDHRIELGADMDSAGMDALRRYVAKAVQQAFEPEARARKLSGASYWSELTRRLEHASRRAVRLVDAARRGNHTRKRRDATRRLVIIDKLRARARARAVAPSVD